MWRWANVCVQHQVLGSVCGFFSFLGPKFCLFSICTSHTTRDGFCRAKCTPNSPDVTCCTGCKLCSVVCEVQIETRRNSSFEKEEKLGSCLQNHKFCLILHTKHSLCAKSNHEREFWPHRQCVQWFAKNRAHDFHQFPLNLRTKPQPHSTQGCTHIRVRQRKVRVVFAFRQEIVFGTSLMGNVGMFGAMRYPAKDKCADFAFLGGRELKRLSPGQRTRPEPL